MKCFNKKLTEGLSVSEIKFLDHFIDEIADVGYINWDKSKDEICINDERIERFRETYCRKESPSCIPDAYVNCISSRLDAYTWQRCVHSDRVYSSGWFEGRPIQKISIPAGVEIIPRNAFANCTALEEVHIPNSVHLIEHDAFRNCKALKSVTAGATIGEYAFAGCSSLQSLNLRWCNRIKEGAFCYCCSLVNVSLPPNLETIGTFSFKGCSALCSVTLPPKLKLIKRDAFESCCQLIAETKSKRVANMCKREKVKVKLIEGLQLNEARQQTAVKSNGIYSVLRDEWIKEPVVEDIPEINEGEFEKLFKKWEDKYFEVIR